MIAVSFVRVDGSIAKISAEPEISLMEAATRHDVPGILGDCGGAMSCATCHVYVDPAWLSRVGAADEIETAMLEMAIAPDERSRLSCQVKLTDALDGLIVHIPQSQL